MAEKELESVMLKFIRDEADVLVATTIVENGLDIPRANTILINRADRLGLAELYQLRGRVGRSNQRAYAYLLVPPEATLSEIARKRLSAMKEFSELGAGFRIAALDLELRGAGNLLGRQQHGHIEAVGFDMYTQMLERAVSKLKGEEAAPDLRTTLNLGLDLRIPQEYIPTENLRLRTYKRVSSIRSEDERNDVARELAIASANCPHLWKTFWTTLFSIDLRAAAHLSRGTPGEPPRDSLSSGNANRSRCVGQGRSLARGNQTRSQRRSLDGNDAWGSCSGGLEKRIART